MCIWYEQQFLDQWQPEYNIRPIADNMLGYKHTKEARGNMSKAQMGNANALGSRRSKETRQKMAMAKMGNTYGLGNAHAAKLSQSDVYEIRRLYNTGKITQTLLGKIFRVTRENISIIIHNKSWRHLNE